MSRQAEINLIITLNDRNVPVEIYWEASESEINDKKKCEAVLLSMWDQEEKNSLMIDLWTNNMQVGEMNAHYYFTLMKMADTYERATNNGELSEKIRNFAKDFAESVDEMVAKES